MDPSLVTIAELYAAGDLDIRGADPIDAMRHVDHLQFRFLPGKVNKAKLLKARAPDPREEPSLHLAGQQVHRQGRPVARAGPQRQGPDFIPL